MSNPKTNNLVLPVLLEIGANIKRLRLENGWTQELLAERASINDKEVSHIEAGKRNITIETLVKIAAAFETEPRSLI